MSVNVRKYYKQEPLFSLPLTLYSFFKSPLLVDFQVKIRENSCSDAQFRSLILRRYVFSLYCVSCSIKSYKVIGGIGVTSQPRDLTVFQRRQAYT